MSDKSETTTETIEPKSTVVVIDNSDLDAVLAEARGEKYTPKDAEKPADKPVETAKPADKIEAEDENGLTAEEKKDLTEKMQKAIGKKHRAKMEAEEFAQSQFNEKQLAIRAKETLERENARLKEQLNPPKVEEAPKEPDRANFKTDKEFADAMIDYRVDQKLKKKEQEDHQKALEDRQREIVQTAMGRIAKAKEIVADYDEVVGAIDTPVPPDVAGYMQESEMFAELGYYLAKNQQELERIGKLSPAKQLVAIGKIESTLKPFEPVSKVETGKPESQDGKTKVEPSNNAKPASKARPEPIKPIDTGSAAQVEKPESEMTYEETKALWAKKHKVNLTARKRH